MSLAVGPLKTGERVATLDVLRGVAVCGILLMNIPYMGLLGDSGMPAFPARPNLDWIAYTTQNVGFAGSMRGLFTLLFGAGMIVMLRSAPDGPEAATSPAGQAYLTRCFALLLLGVAQFALFLWPGEILFNYGLAGFVLLLFRRAQPRLLLTASAAILVTMSIMGGSVDLERAKVLRDARSADQARAAHQTLTKEQSTALEGRAEILRAFHPATADLARERARRTAFPEVLAWSTEVWVKYNLRDREALWWLLESIAFMLLGVALLKARVLTGERSLRFYALLAAGGYGLGLLIRGARAWASWKVGFEPDPDVFWWGGFVYEAGRLPMTLGLVGLVVLLFRAGALGWIAAALKAIGRMALTNYVGQSVITSILFYGLGYVGSFGFAALMGIAALIWVAQGLLSLAWLSRWEMGPFEWLLRSLTYGRLQPLGRARPATLAAPAIAE